MFNLFQRNPENVRARQRGRTARKRARFADNANARAFGQPTGFQALLDGANRFHDGANDSAEAFFGVAAGQAGGGAFGFGGGGPPAPPAPAGAGAPAASALPGLPGGPEVPGVVWAGLAVLVIALLVRR